MFFSGRSSYVLASLLTILLHAGLAAVLVAYHDQIATLQLVESEPLKMRLFNSDFQPIPVQPVQSRLIVEQPAPEPAETRQEAQPAPKKQSASPKKKSTSTKSRKAAPPKKTKTQQKAKPDPIDNKLKQLRDNKTTPQSSEQITSPDSPELRVAKRYVGRIQKQIEKNWIKPLNVQYREMAGLKVLIRLLLTPEGNLERAEIIQSSGNSQFDRSALNAVYKTGQFQVPGDAKIFQQYFRRLTISYNL